MSALRCAATLHLNAHDLMVWTNRETSGDGFHRRPLTSRRPGRSLDSGPCPLVGAPLELREILENFSEFPQALSPSLPDYEVGATSHMAKTNNPKNSKRRVIGKPDTRGKARKVHFYEGAITGIIAHASTWLVLISIDRIVYLVGHVAVLLGIHAMDFLQR